MNCNCNDSHDLRYCWVEKSLNMRSTFIWIEFPLLQRCLRNLMFSKNFGHLQRDTCSVKRCHWQFSDGKFQNPVDDEITTLASWARVNRGIKQQISIHNYCDDFFKFIVGVMEIFHHFFFSPSLPLYSKLESGVVWRHRWIEIMFRATPLFKCV